MHAGVVASSIDDRVAGVVRRSGAYSRALGAQALEDIRRRIVVRIQHQGTADGLQRRQGRRVGDPRAHGRGGGRAPPHPRQRGQRPGRRRRLRGVSREAVAPFR